MRRRTFIKLGSGLLICSTGPTWASSFPASNTVDTLVCITLLLGVPHRGGTSIPLLSRPERFPTMHDDIASVNIVRDILGSVPAPDHYYAHSLSSHWVSTSKLSLRQRESTLNKTSNQVHNYVNQTGYNLASNADIAAHWDELIAWLNAGSDSGLVCTALAFGRLDVYRSSSTNSAPSPDWDALRKAHSNASRASFAGYKARCKSGDTSLLTNLLPSNAATA